MKTVIFILALSVPFFGQTYYAGAAVDPGDGSDDSCTQPVGVAGPGQLCNSCGGCKCTCGSGIPEDVWTAQCSYADCRDIFIEQRTCPPASHYCCVGCTGPCVSDTNWSSGNPGYQKKVNRACNCNTCVDNPVYRCVGGYYGTSTNGTSGCIACPPSGTSTIDDNITITGCYMSGGGTDVAGIWTFIDACYYNN